LVGQAGKLINIAQAASSPEPHRISDLRLQSPGIPGKALVGRDAAALSLIAVGIGGRLNRAVVEAYRPGRLD
jgi:hypothetical protein